MTDKISFFPEEKLEENVFVKNDNKFLTNQYSSKNIEEAIDLWLSTVSQKVSFFNWLLTDFLIVSLLMGTPIYMILDAIDVVDKSDSLSFMSYVMILIGSLFATGIMHMASMNYFYYKDKKRDILKNKSFQTALLHKMNNQYKYFKSHNIQIMEYDEYKSDIDYIITIFANNDKNNFNDVAVWKKIVVFFLKVKSHSNEIKAKEAKKKFEKELNLDLPKV